MSFWDTPRNSPSKGGSLQNTPRARPVSAFGNTRSRSNSPQKRNAAQQQGNVKVVVRFRPENESEKTSKRLCTVADESMVSVPDSGVSFAFDRVFDETCSQKTIFQYSIQDAVENLFQGYNGTVIAYGQTGSGKSFTMMGPSFDEELKGVIPRISDQLFYKIAESSADMEFTVSVSYLEIYMEQLRDLLVEQQTRSELTIHESKTGEVFVKGLTNQYISGRDELYEAIAKGAAARKVSSTNMNDESSRSHTILQITLSQQSSNTGMVKKGTLFLVDLAGSEKAAKTGASGQTFEEAKKINSSLSALGNVINALTDGSRHIPYRNSKLTRILQESLGGNSCTTLIVNCSLSSLQEQETLSSLRFGVRAKKIKNVIHVNTEMSVSQLKTRLQQEQEENFKHRARIAALERELASYKTGSDVFLPAVPICDSETSSVVEEDEVARLNHVIADLNATNKILLADLESRCTKIVELEMEIDRLKDGNSGIQKLGDLDQTIAKMSAKMKEMELQNEKLCKEIIVAQTFSETRNQRIKVLEAQLNDQNKVLQRDSYTFEERLTFLKTRLTAVKGASFASQRPLHDSTNTMDSTYTPTASPVKAVTPEDIDAVKQARQKVGINLRIVKPLKGGSETREKPM